MSQIRIIPRLDIKGPTVVKGVHTEGLRVVGDPASLAEKYYNDGADELLYMDIVASLYGRSLDLALVKKVAEKIFIPLTVGGGIASLHDIDNVLRAGADKVAINTHAVLNPEFLKEAVRKFGSQCIVLSVEARRQANGTFQVYTDGGREESGRDVISWVKEALEYGVGEIILTSIDADGTYRGFDLELVSAVRPLSHVPLIAHGGARDIASIEEVIVKGKADAVGVASLFHYGTLSIADLKRGLKERGLGIRI